MVNTKIPGVLLFFTLFLPTIVTAELPPTELELSKDESEWLESKPTIKFTGDPNWLPYEAFDKHGNYIGIVSEHLNLITEITGLKFTMSPSKTWTESTQKAKQGLVDVLSETDDSDLRSHLNFTIPYISNHIVIVMHNKENYVENIDAIKDRKIALIKDYGYASKIRRKYSNIQFVTVDNIQDGLISVSTGEVDALLCTLALCSYTISELGLNNVKITGKTEFDTKLALGVQKNLPELLSILNKAINKISHEQQQVILNNWIKDKFKEKIDYTLALQVTAAAIVLLIIFSLWIRRLSREINLRITKEEELRAAEEVLRHSHQRLLLYREYSPLGVIEWNTNFEVLDWNPAAQHIFGYTKEEVLNRHITETILPEGARKAADKIWSDLLENKGGNYSVNENTTKDGRTILCEWHNTPLVDDNGNAIGVTSLVGDITDKQLEEENLRHSQKMDAIGKITGGIAHDFNNMLGVIIGFSTLLKERVNKNDPTQIKYCNQILTAGDRCQKLTSKLLEFSRKTTSSAETTDINDLLNSMQHMLEKILTLRIKLVFELEDNLWPTLLDKTRLEDAILNICINSMHAMQNGGTLTLSTSNIHFDDIDTHKINDIEQGDYVLISISDTGIGMTQEVKREMFDPFFTTKGTEGTGLGLSQVYGFIQQSCGDIKVYSKPEHGTRIQLYFPRLMDTSTIRPEEKTTEPENLPSGNETILVVDDEIALLDLNEDVLTSKGYTVLRAENADQALNILESNPVDLLLSDVIMPGMDGYQLAHEVEKRYPDMKIQLISGYTDKGNIDLTNNSLHERRLQKPINAGKLLRRVRELLSEDVITRV